jgi:serine/threonine-protein kinase
MLTEADKHVAAMAVSVYGVDRARVKQAYQAVLKARAQGQEASLLEVLLAQELLAPDQAKELRLALATTHLDPAAPPNRRDGPPAEAGSPFELRKLGDYRILRRLGEGGMGSVYLGYQEAGGRHVAIKVLPDHLASNQAYVDRFYREAKSGALLDHPNIVRNLAVGQDRTTAKHYIVLEYVDGPSAHSLLQQYGRLKVGDALHIALDIARALEHAHSRSIVHRDIKPDNILLTQSGVAKLSDLGLAKRTDEASHLTAARQGFGTPYYMPYEQAMNAKYADGRSDIYALGATLYHLLTGETPFTGGTHLEIVEKKNLGVFTPASDVNPDVPPAVDRMLDQMLARDPGDRYQTASELIVDLERSGLVAPVPSFIDPDRALQDPLVRARLTAPAEPTRPDLAAPAANGTAESDDPNVWYLRYRNREGKWCKARLTTPQVMQRLREGRLTAAGVEACHQSQGEFRPLAAFAEFREVVLAAPPVRKRVAPQAQARPKPAAKVAEAVEEARGGRRRQIWLVCVGLGVLLAVAVGAYLLFR